MKSNVNLLPVELIPKTNIVKLANFFKAIALTGFVVFLVLAAIGGAALILLSAQLENTNTRLTSLKKQVVDLNKTEQGLYLIKDRIDKVKEVLTTSVDERLTKFEKLNNSLLPGTGIVEVDIGKDVSKVSVLTANSKILSAFYNSLYVSGIYDRIKLIGITYKNQKGYLVEMDVF